MKNYSDVIDINSIFSTSINLWLDFNNEEKIKQYIPTREASLIINYYLHSILGGSKENQNFRATTLVGPYGKGKSFLILVLIFIISHNSSNQTWKYLKTSFSSVNTETADLMEAFDKKGLKLMPILINNDYDTLRQAFLVALSQSLKENNVSDVMPETSFDIASDIVKKWEKDKDFVSVINSVLDRQSINLEQLKTGLVEKNSKAYDVFVSTYNSIVRGQPFNPLIMDSLPATIRSIAQALFLEKGYAGIFFVFDEFSKFLDTDSSSYSEELRTLQEVYELCNNTGFETQIHICSIIHKPISYYAKNKSQTRKNNFKTIEGRVKELFFNRSVFENFNLIEHAILKRRGFDVVFNAVFAKHKRFYEEVENTELRSLCDSQLLEKGCFPFNPFSVYALISLAEKIAQNERTIFTFLSDDDPNSFNTFIKNNGNGLLCVDQLYDYFLRSFISVDDETVKRIYYKSNIVLASRNEEIEQRVIKALAVICMIDDRLTFPPTRRYLALATQIDGKEVDLAVDALIKDNFLKESIFDCHLSFTGVNSAEISDRINNLLNDKNFNFQIADIFSAVSKEKYVIPRRYNAKMKMTRYYRIVYIEADKFLKLEDFSIFSEGKPYADGNVIKIIYTGDDETIIPQIKKKYKTLENSNYVIIIPQTALSDKEYLFVKQYSALNELAQTLKDEQAIKEIRIMKKEFVDDLESIVNAYYNDAVCFPKSEETLSEQISEQLFEIYPKTPIINNELFNKNIIKSNSTYDRARRNVLNVLLGLIPLSVYSSTSPEVTIFNAVFKGNSGQCDNSVVSCINYVSNIVQSVQEGKSEPFANLVNPLKQPPYGVRNGVLPLIIVNAIQSLPENDFVLELDKKELPLTAENIINATQDQKKRYKFRVLSNLSEKRAYVAELMAVFGVSSTGRLREDVLNLGNAIKVYCFNLPGVVKASNKKKNIVGLDDLAINFLSYFLKMDINSYEKIFEQIPRISGKLLSYSESIIIVRNIKESLDSALTKFKHKICNQLLNEFNCGQEDMNSFISRYSQLSTNGSSNELLNVLNVEVSNLPCDENLVLDKFSVACLKQHIRDWNYDKSNDLISAVKDCLANENSDKKIKVDRELISFPDFDGLEDENPLESSLMNMIKDSIESFGDSLSKSQKVSVLIRLIKEIE